MDKKNNKKLKQYKKKYFTGGRVDMSKGGRVKAARGFTGEPQEIKPIQQTKKKPIKKPIQPAPKKPVQPGIPVTGTGNLKTGTPATLRDLPPGTTGSPTLPGVKIDPRLPPKGRPRNISIGGVGGGTGTIRPAPVGGPVELPKDELPIQERDFQRSRPPSIGGVGGGISDDRAISPLERPRFIDKKDSDQSIDQARAMQNASAQVQAQPQARTTQAAQPKGSGFFGTLARLAREQAQAKQAAQAQGQKGPGEPGMWWRDLGYNSPKEALDDGWKYDYQTRTWTQGTTTGGTTTGGTTTGGTTTETETPTEPTAEELAAQEKARQQQVARQSAEAAARGEVPEAAQIPQAEQVGYERDAQGQLILDEQGNPIPLREQQITTMDPVTRARTDIEARGQAPEAVATSQAAQADTTIGQDIKAGEITDVAKVADKDVEVKAAEEKQAREIEEVAPGKITAGVKFATVDELQAEAGKAKTVDDVLTGTY